MKNKNMSWIMVLVSLVLSVVSLCILPDRVPVHFTITGEVNSWGSKYIDLIFTAIVGIFIALMLFTSYSIVKDKKISNISDKSDVYNASNVKVLNVVSITVSIILVLLQASVTVIQYLSSRSNGDSSSINVINIVFALLGVMFIVIGNIMPKTRKNSIIGVRTKWSMYNDTTWHKSNHFGGIVFIVAGIAIVFLAMFCDLLLLISGIMAIVLISTIIVIIKSHSVWKKEQNSQSKTID